jgi:Uma2 family endonuclease
VISVQDYLSTVYRPDRDYVDGEVLERNFGDADHAWTLTAVASYLHVRRKEWNITALIGIRVRVQPERFRVPDIGVVVGRLDEQILTKPPFLCIEILSPEDRWSRVEARIKDFIAMGVPYIWMLDPQTKTAFIETAADGLREVKDGFLRTENPSFIVPLSEFFLG